MNKLARREAAIVSPYAGTTRDVIEVHLDLGGYPVTILDTAGLRSSDDPVERKRIRRATERSGAADLVLWVVDASAPEPTNPPEWLEGAEGRSVWSVFNKCDLVEEGKAGLFAGNPLFVGACYCVSAATGRGLSPLSPGIAGTCSACFRYGWARGDNARTAPRRFGRLPGGVGLGVGAWRAFGGGYRSRGAPFGRACARTAGGSRRCRGCSRRDLSGFLRW